LSNGQWFRGRNEVYLSAVFGAFLLYAAGYNVYRLFSGRQFPDVTDTDALAIPRWKAALSVGLPMGLIGGLLGVGGGIIAVPLQQLLLRIPLRRAIANSAVTIVPLSIIGAVYKNVANAQAGVDFTRSLQIALCLIPTAMIGALFGGRLTHTAPRKALRLAVILLLGYGGLKMLLTPSKGPKPAAPASSQVSERQ
jgi:uncharacterized protein